MADLKRNEILKKAKEAFSAPGFFYKGIAIWPFIRISIYLSIKQSNASRDLGKTSARLFFLLKGVLGLVKLWIRTPRVDHLLVTSSMYKVTEGGIVKDRILDPFLAYCTENGLNFKVLEFTNKYSYDKRLSYLKDVLKLQPVLYLLSMIWRFEFFFRKRFISFQQEKAFNSFLTQAGITFQINTPFKWRLFLLFRQFEFYKWFFGKIGLKRLLVVCYYDIKNLPMIMASHYHAIPSIDLQHGVQNQDHLAYSGWSPDESKSHFIPTHFYVWEESSRDVIAHWRGKTNTLLGCNKWVLDRVAHEEKKYILYSLQPLSDPFPANLISTVKKYSGTLQWVFRLHPQQVYQFEEFKENLQRLGVYEKVVLMAPMEETLMKSLARTSIHVTKFSSVAIEAAYFGIPTVFLDQKGMEIFEKDIDQALLYNSSDEEFNEYIDQYRFVGVNTAYFQEEKLKRFKSIESFFN